MAQGNWLFFRVFFPSLCTALIFFELGEISRLAIFTWLGAALLLVAIAVDVVGLVLMGKRAMERKREQRASRGA